MTLFLRGYARKKLERGHTENVKLLNSAQGPKMSEIGIKASLITENKWHITSASKSGKLYGVTLHLESCDYLLKCNSCHGHALIVQSPILRANMYIWFTFKYLKKRMVFLVC